MKLPNTLPAFNSVTPEKAKELFFTYEYGIPPKHPENITFTETAVRDTFCAGKAVLHSVTAKVQENGKSFSFPFWFTAPKTDKPVPGVVMINFRSFVPDEYLPSEELCDLGIAVASFDYQSVSPDNDDFESLAGGFLGINRNDPYAPGKIAIWAWAASIVMDYMQTRPEVDKNKIAVSGHSRLGKTALLTGLIDNRFKFIHSNDSGCSGAAIFRNKVGESAERIHDVFPFWFCPNFENHCKDVEALPFDQHWLISLLAPRYVYVASAIEDTWADPQSELASCIAATPAFEALGVSGLVGDPEDSYAGLTLHDGHIGYHCRSGRHYFSREDWQELVAYMKKHLN